MFFSGENGTYAHSIILIIKVIDFSIIKQSKKKKKLLRYQHIYNVFDFKFNLSLFLD